MKKDNLSHKQIMNLLKKLYTELSASNDKLKGPGWGMDLGLRKESNMKLKRVDKNKDLTKEAQQTREVLNPNSPNKTIEQTKSPNSSPFDLNR